MKFLELFFFYDDIKNNLYVYSKKGLEKNKIYNERGFKNWFGIFQGDIEFGKYVKFQFGVQFFNVIESVF